MASRRKVRRLLIATLLLVSGIGAWKYYQVAGVGGEVSQPELTASQRVVSRRVEARDADPTHVSGEAIKQAGPSSPEDADPAVTRAKRLREALARRSGTTKAVSDPMASWEDLPPWPEGPRLYAEVETSSKKYINLRPDDYGSLPRIRTSPGELLEIKIIIPEAAVGEKIHVEMPNGGGFSDSEVAGRIYEVQSGHSFSFSIFADEARGNCNVKLRHRGHTRSIPLWVGEPEETGS